MVWQSALGGVAGGIDRLFHAAVLNRSRPSSAESLSPVARIRLLEELLARLAQDPWTDDELFPAPAVPEITQTEVRSTSIPAENSTVSIHDLSYVSPHRVIYDQVRERWARYPQNQRVHARFVHQGDRRPTLIFLHGYLGGPYPVEERVWPLRWLQQKGVNAVLFTLPFHGARRRSKGAPPFPAADPTFTIEGFRQAILDLHALIRWLRDRGAPKIGLVGMSLGGYTTALAATTLDLDVAVPFIPLASIADFARDGGRLIGTPTQRREQHEFLERVYASVSPLTRAPRVPVEGRLVIGGKHDHITPIAHAERLANHFETPLVTFEGGHLLQLDRSRGFRALGRMLGSLGWFA
ncbi:MAG: alpha/beta fold hydrolase [Myxococcota bacterium]